MEIGLRWLDGRTLLTLTQRGVPSDDVERGFIEGWNEFLDGFVARIQTRPAIWAGGDERDVLRRGTDRCDEEGCDGHGHFRNIDVA
jgi:hypothetical protein